MASYSWDPSPIASAGGLKAGQKVTVSLAALDVGGAPVPRALVEVTFTPAPHSDVTVKAPSGCLGGPPVFSCTTDATGHLTFTYTRAEGRRQLIAYYFMWWAGHPRRRPAPRGSFRYSCLPASTYSRRFNRRQL